MKIQIPTQCPCCNSVLELVNDQLFCRNTGCSAQLSKKVEHFCSVLSIKGFGQKTLEKVGLSDLTELFYLEESDLIEALSSEKLGSKLYLEIQKARNAPLEVVLAAMSIPLVGATAAKKICSVVKTIDEITQETCKQAGLGDKVTTNLLNWLETDFKDMREFLPFSFEVGKVIVDDATKPKICITGKLVSTKTKAEAAKLLEAAGYIVVDSVTKTTDLLLDESDSGSEKRKKAEQYGIRIINNLYNIIKE